MAGNGISGGAGTPLALSLSELTAKASLVDADELGMVDSADSNASKIVTWANLKTQAVTDLLSRTDWQVAVPLWTGTGEGGTWTPTLTSNVLTVVRTASAATEYFYAPITVPNRTGASAGVKLVSVDVAYTIDATDTTNDDLEIRIVKNTVGTDGNATTGTILAGDADADYDDAHNTKAERLDATGSPELHTATVTIPVGEQAFCADNETYWLQIKVTDNAGPDLALILTGAVANFQLVL